MKKQTSLITLSLMLASPALAGGGGAPVAGGGAAGACRTITQIVSTDPQFSTLLTAVQAAGLAEMLAGGQFTVFAPTNAAFAKVPSDQLATLLNDQDMLRSVLQYHVVAGKVTAKQVASLRSVKTAQGANLTISAAGNRVMVGGANVTRTDIAACNGVVHVIDTVLMPPMAAAAPAPATPAATTTTDTAATTTTDTAATTTTDTAATTTTDTAATTTTDTAATTTTGTAATTTTTTTAAPAFDVRNIPALPLSGATVSGAAGTTTTTTGTAATTTTGTAATTTTDTAATTTTDTAAATTTTDAAAPATNTLYDVIVADDRFSTLRDLLSDAGLTETLTSGEFTIFAPTNEAFEAIPAEQLAALSENPELLRRVLSYHVVQGRISAEQLAGGAVLTTSEGSPLTPSGSGANQLVGTATVGTAITTASNGTIYVINQVLLPPGLTLPTPSGATDTSTAAATTDTTATTGTAATGTATTGTATTGTTATTTATTTTATTTTTANNTVVTLITSDPRFSTLARLIQQAGLAEQLASGEFTIFAPTNEAFAKISAADLAAITGNPARLRQVLLYHVVQGRQTPQQLAAGTALTSLETGSLALSMSGKMVGMANVGEALTTAGNGTIYVIDTVLLPAAR